MKNVTFSKKITLELTPDEWAMYDITGAERAARELNRHVAAAINGADTLAVANSRVRELLHSYSKYGVDDTEGHVVADKLLALAFDIS